MDTYNNYLAYHFRHSGFESLQTILLSYLKGDSIKINVIVRMKDNGFTMDFY